MDIDDGNLGVVNPFDTDIEDIPFEPASPRPPNNLASASQSQSNGNAVSHSLDNEPSGISYASDDFKDAGMSLFVCIHR